MATAAVPDGVVLGISVGVADSSPSQERLTRIAAMLRDAERSGHATAAQARGQRRKGRAYRIGRAP